MSTFNLSTAGPTPSSYHDLAQRLPLRILLAEDCPIERSICLSMLEDMGYEVNTVTDGLEVLRALQCQEYDIVLMDMWMPHLDGIATTHAIYDAYPDDYSYYYKRPHIIGMTVIDNQNWYETYLSAGVNDCLIKPILYHSLQTMLEKWGYPEHHSQ